VFRLNLRQHMTSAPGSTRIAHSWRDLRARQLETCQATVRCVGRSGSVEPVQPDHRKTGEAGVSPKDARALLLATSAHLRATGRRSLGGIDRQSRFVAAAGVAEVLARGPIRGGLQAHVAVARVAEQPPASTPSLLMLGTMSDHLGALVAVLG
jgi:hypothetical protein